MSDKVHELTQVMKARELVTHPLKGCRRPDKFTQERAVWSTLNMVGPDVDLEYLRDLAGQEYGRPLTLGVTLRNKYTWPGFSKV